MLIDILSLGRLFSHYRTLIFFRELFFCPSRDYSFIHRYYLTIWKLEFSRVSSLVLKRCKTSTKVKKGYFNWSACFKTFFFCNSLRHFCFKLLQSSFNHCNTYASHQRNKTMVFLQDIQRHVLGRLRSLLFGNEADAESTGEVLEYFMRRLSSVQTAERDSAVKVHCKNAREQAR